MHRLPDLINGAFEVFGAVAVFLSLRQLYRDKQVRGFHPLTLAFFTSWGGWNLWFYPHLKQWASFGGAFATFALNTLYFALTLWYIRNRRPS